MFFMKKAALVACSCFLQVYIIQNQVEITSSLDEELCLKALSNQTGVFEHTFLYA